MKIWLQSTHRVGTMNTPRWAILGLAALVLVTGTLAWVLRPEQHLIVVNGMGTPITFKTTEQQVGAALRAQGIELGAKDKVTPELIASLEGQTEVTVVVKQAVPVTLTVGGVPVEVMTAADTVGDLLREMEIVLGASDSLSMEPTEAVQSHMVVKVVRRSESTEIVRAEIPFGVVRESDRTMMIGETKEIQAGVNGLKEIRKVTFYEDGQETGSEVAEEVIVAEPVDQVVAYGTMGLVSRGGTNYRFSREMTLEATGYTAGKESNPNGNGYTYTGMKAVRGVVAVDPRVIPLYTRLYIEGYGEAIAADIGGAIKGEKIDLCFDTVAEALTWGRRPVKVYILDQ